MAALELFQQTGNREILKKLYPGLHALWRKASGLDTWNALRTFELDADKDGLISAPGGGSGIDDAPSQIWSRASGVDWARQENYWTTPIPANPTGKVIETESVNLTAFTILGAKILRLFEKNPEFDNYIKLAENSLQKYCWNSGTGHFHWVTGDSHEQTPYFDLSGLTPLFSRTWKDEEQYKRMLEELFDKFYANREQIETSCGFKLAWDRLDSKKASLACTYIQGLDFDNPENYPELMNKAIDLVLTMRKVFVPFLK